MRPEGPNDAPGTADPPALDTLTALAAARTAGRHLVAAQLGQSLDGRIATPTGHSHYVNGAAALTVLHRLRASVDAVVVGAGTAASDDPRLTVRRCAGDNPARVLIDGRRRAGAALRLLNDDGARRIVFGQPLADDPAGVECVALPEGASARSIIEGLGARGLKTILVEGGATTVSRFLHERAIDRLCVLVAPLIVGSGPQGITLPAIATLSEALRPRVAVTLLSDGDVVFDCDLRATRSM